MTTKELVNIAVTAIDKNMDYETLRYSDYMYGEEEHTDAVWEFVTEAKEYGMIWFYDTYRDYLD